MIISRTIGMRSSPKNMCSVRTSPMPTAPAGATSRRVWLATLLRASVLEIVLVVTCIVLAVPSSRGKGVLVSPTIYGNVMVGPTSENLQDRSATGTSEDGFEFLVSKGRALMPSLFDEEITATYAGLRAATNR